MGLADDMKILSEDIVASYGLRVKTIRELEKDTHDMLKGFQSEHKKMATDLKKTLAEGEADRLKETGNMMNQIRGEQKDRNKAVADLLEKFAKDHEDMAAELRETLAEGEADRLKETGNMMNQIRGEQKDRNKAVADLLEEHKTEREKMSASWQALNAAMAKRRSGKPTVEAEVKVSSVKEAIEEETKERKVSPGIGLGEKEYA